jgi:hypothetical protein
MGRLAQTSNANIRHKPNHPGVDDVAYGHAIGALAILLRPNGNPDSGRRIMSEFKETICHISFSLKLL